MLKSSLQYKRTVFYLTPFFEVAVETDFIIGKLLSSSFFATQLLRQLVEATLHQQTPEITYEVKEEDVKPLFTTPQDISGT